MSFSLLLCTFARFTLHADAHIAIIVLLHNVDTWTGQRSGHLYRLSLFPAPTERLSFGHPDDTCNQQERVDIDRSSWIKQPPWELHEDLLCSIEMCPSPKP